MAALAPTKMLGTRLHFAGSSRHATAAPATAQKIVSLFRKKPAQKAKPAAVSSSGSDIGDELAKWYGPDRRIFLPEGLLDRSEVPEYLNGEVPGDYGYDPFGLSKKPDNFAKYQAYELIHARWAMLGAAGFIIPEACNKFGANCGPEAVWFKTGALLLDGNTLNYFGNSIPINLVLAVIAEIVLVGGAEYYRIINGLVSNIKHLKRTCAPPTKVAIISVLTNGSINFSGAGGVQDLEDKLQLERTHSNEGEEEASRRFEMKVIEKIREAAADGRTVFSFEYFPPKTEEGVENLFERMDRMVAHGPTFGDITWGAGGSTADLTLEIANRMQNMVCVETMMHLTCTNMPVEKIDHALDTIKTNGIQNVLALRGDPPHGQGKFVQVAGGFACALDLVQHIRAKYGDYFGITVAGYPEAHPDVIIQGEDGATPEAYSNDLAYLKRKVDAGADIIITQLFYDTDIFLKFVNDCRQIGITCPIVPGIMPINNYKGFLRMTGFCKNKIPAEITAALDPIKDNEEAVKAYGVHLGTEMCKKILASGIKTLHLYTLNMEKSALAILMNLGLIEESKVSRSLPWRPPTNVFRVKEDVRPIFWANRPKSYIARTLGWDQYPHGRWGDSRNPSYGALTDYQFTRPRGRGKKLQEEWAVPLKSVEDIHERFMNFCQGKLTSSPWSELDGLQPETKIIDDQLVKINLKGFLTINSQPAVNGERSDSPSVGWGGPGGYVYQKAYVEFFCAKEKLEQLTEKSKAFPSLTYIAVNKDGESLSNIPANAVNAVTWGVLPGKEIIQPTVVDSASFMVWKDEAFEIWSRGWACLFPEGDSSRELLEKVQKSYYLVSLVDNDYIHGDLFAVFKEI